MIERVTICITKTISNLNTKQNRFLLFNIETMFIFLHRNSIVVALNISISCVCMRELYKMILDKIRDKRWMIKSTFYLNSHLNFVRVLV